MTLEDLEFIHREFGHGEFVRTAQYERFDGDEMQSVCDMVDCEVC